jgi:putative salt-induced outer membrane protein
MLWYDRRARARDASRHGKEAPLKLSIVWLGAVLAVPALGQEAPPPPPVWSGEAALSYVQITGNSDSGTLGAGLKLVHLAGPWKINFGTAFVRTETDGVKSAEKLDALLRGERAFGERVAVYGQGAYLRDLFAGIDGQETFESGVLYKLAIGPKHFLSLSAALAYTAEQRAEPDPDRNFLGARGGLFYKWQISPNADFTEDVSYLQSFEDSQDGRVQHRATLTANVNKVFALKLGHELLYYRDPVPGKKSTDNTILASIVARWPAPAPPPPPCPPCPPAQ